MPLRRSLVVGAGLAALLALIIAYVPDGQIAVRERFGGRAVALGAGVHVRVPILHRLFRYDTHPVSLDEPIEIITKDNASFKLPVRISAWPSAGDLITFHSGCSGREPIAYVRERVREGIRTAARALNADDILTSDVARVVGPTLSADLIARGISDDGIEVGHPSPQVILNAVIDYLARNFPASARRLAEHAVKEAPEESLYQTAMGIVLEAEGRSLEAERAYLDSLFLDPAGIESMSRLFFMYQAEGERDSIARLERLLLAALERSPDSPVHHHWLGQVYMRMGRGEEAEGAFLEAIRLLPEEPEYRVSLGGLKIQENELEEARAALQEALELQGDHTLALFNMGVSFAIGGDIESAIEFFHRSERAGRPSHVLFNSLAQAYEQKGDLDRAAEYLRESLRLVADQPQRREALTRIEARLRTPN